MAVKCRQSEERPLGHLRGISPLLCKPARVVQQGNRTQSSTAYEQALLMHETPPLRSVPHRPYLDCCAGLLEGAG